MKRPVCHRWGLEHAVDVQPPQTQGERALLLAILRRALMDLFEYDVCSCHPDGYMGVRRSAWNFLLDEAGDGSEPFSIAWMCETLGVELCSLQRAVKRAVTYRDYSGFQPFINGNDLRDAAKCLSLGLTHRVAR